MVILKYMKWEIRKRIKKDLDKENGFLMKFL